MLWLCKIKYYIWVYQLRKTMKLSKRQRAIIKYQNTICCCDNERECSPCRNGEYKEFIENEIK